MFTVVNKRFRTTFFHSLLIHHLILRLVITYLVILVLVFGSKVNHAQQSQVPWRALHEVCKRVLMILRGVINVCVLCVYGVCVYRVCV